MTMKKIILTIVLLLAIVSALVFWRHWTSMKRYFGIMPGAYLVSEFSNKEVKALSYQLILDHPAQSVIALYETRMKAKGWVAVEWKGLGNLRHWNIGKHEDPETKRPYCEYTYQAAWAIPSNELVVLMTLVYQDTFTEPTSDAPCPTAPKDNGLVVSLKELRGSMNVDQQILDGQPASPPRTP
jgi:hypothetical protein